MLRTISDLAMGFLITWIVFCVSASTGIYQGLSPRVNDSGVRIQLSEMAQEGMTSTDVAVSLQSSL